MIGTALGKGMQGTLLSLFYFMTLQKEADTNMLKCVEAEQWLHGYLLFFNAVFGV